MELYDPAPSLAEKTVLGSQKYEKKAKLKVLQKLFFDFGLPARKVTGRGASFTSSAFKAFCEEHGIKHLLDAVACPRTYGSAERYNQLILNSLAAQNFNGNERDWHKQLGKIQWDANNTINTTKKTPTETLFGTQDDVECISQALGNDRYQVTDIPGFPERGTSCLRNVQLVVPESVVRGSRVEMRCTYDLEQEILYTVKWYRGDREFCRYSPRDVPPLKIFRIPGIEVDRDASDATRMTIRAATRVANGQYTCEVSADAPSFQTARLHAHMYVVDIPSSGPEVLGLNLFYRVGMKLKVECGCYNSQPPANLTFAINNELAHDQHVWHRVSPANGSLWNAYITMQFIVQQHHFIRGKMKIRCTATIYSSYGRSNELCALEERIATTPDSLYKTNEVAIYPIHRTAPTSDCADRIHGYLLSVFFIVLWNSVYLNDVK
ncbi:uncharacterized protein [Battus philenor]|uniref:uncharacterized protein n=1 Tax=Battus philenor TaxID=42288 RepID=UPI0035CEE7CD